MFDVGCSPLECEGCWLSTLLFKLRLAALRRSPVTGKVSRPVEEEDSVDDKDTEMGTKLGSDVAAAILAGDDRYEDAIAGLFDKDRCMGVEES